MDRLNMYAISVLRERMGLEPDDDSRDEEIRNMSDSKKVKEIITWEYGIGHYANFMNILARVTGREIKDIENSIFNNK